MASELEDLVAHGYDSVADAYEALETDAPWPRLRRLEDFLRGVRPGSRVLDLGCGCGVPVLATIVGHGHDAVGVDLSAEQVARARRNVPGAELHHASALDLDLPGGSLDAIVSFYVLEHMPRETHAGLLAKMHGWLRPGGRLLFTVESGDEPGLVGDWLGTPMYFSHFDAAGTTDLVRRAGFDVLEVDEEEQLEGGSPVPYVWILARKPGAAA